MDFFEALRSGGMAKCGYAEYEIEYESGVNNTIEALKEMMVLPCPFTATLRHAIEYKEDGVITRQDHTIFQAPHQEAFEGHHGTDGEEVMGILFRGE